MFDKLLDLVVQFASSLVPWTIVDEYERAVVLTAGRFRGRVLEPGFHWIWPFGVDKVLTDNVVSSTFNLYTQTLTTRDGQPIQLSAMIRWKIRDIVKILLECEDSGNVLRDVTYGEIAKAVRDSTWDQINTDEWVTRVHRAARKRAFAWGMEIEEVQITDLSKVKVIRLINAA